MLVIQNNYDQYDMSLIHIIAIYSYTIFILSDVCIYIYIFFFRHVYTCMFIYMFHGFLSVQTQVTNLHGDSVGTLSVIFSAPELQ